MHWLLLLAAGLLAAAAATHALLYKRDPRSSLGWIVVSLMFPVAGPLLYYLLGINRIRSRARALHRRHRFHLDPGGAPVHASATAVADPAASVIRVADRISRRPLVGGNRVTPLSDGDVAYPAMLDAIARARRRVYLCTYIFQVDDTGLRFVAALAAALRRGVEVKVIVDGVGEWYALPRLVTRLLKREGIETTRFLPPRLLPPQVYFNLRTHRKLLVVDGGQAFLGGMNIDARNVTDPGHSRPHAHDLHFHVEGEVVGQLERVFLEDWGFCTGCRDIAPTASHKRPSPSREPGAAAMCRAIVDGPNEEVHKLTTILVAAIAAAHRRIGIMTPYFLPPREIVVALQGAALRGVEVSIVLPGRNNLPLVHWATRNMLWELVEREVRVYYQPPPFAHTKLMLIDDDYAQIGSANLDTRSLRLNFELALEVLDPDFVGGLWKHLVGARRSGREITLDELDGRPLPGRIRDALAWLCTPYL